MTFSRQDCYMSLPEDVWNSTALNASLSEVSVLFVPSRYRFITKVDRHLGQAADIESKAEREAYKRQIARQKWQSKVRGTCFAWCS